MSNFPCKLRVTGALSMTLFPTCIQKWTFNPRRERGSTQRASALNIGSCPSSGSCRRYIENAFSIIRSREQIASVGLAKNDGRRMRSVPRTEHRAPTRTPERRSISNRHFFPFFLMDNPEQTNSTVPYYRDVCRRTYHTRFSSLRSATCRTRWIFTDRRTIFGRSFVYCLDNYCMMDGHECRWQKWKWSPGRARVSFPSPNQTRSVRMMY